MELIFVSDSFINLSIKKKTCRPIYLRQPPVIVRFDISLHVEYYNSAKEHIGFVAETDTETSYSATEKPKSSTHELPKSQILKF